MLREVSNHGSLKVCILVGVRNHGFLKVYTSAGK